MPDNTHQKYGILYILYPCSLSHIDSIVYLRIVYDHGSVLDICHAIINTLFRNTFAVDLSLGNFLNVLYQSHNDISLGQLSDSCSGNQNAKINVQ